MQDHVHENPDGSPRDEVSSRLPQTTSTLIRLQRIAELLHIQCGSLRRAVVRVATFTAFGFCVCCGGGGCDLFATEGLQASKLQLCVCCFAKFGGTSPDLCPSQREEVATFGRLNPLCAEGDRELVRRIERQQTNLLHQKHKQLHCLMELLGQNVEGLTLSEVELLKELEHLNQLEV